MQLTIIILCAGVMFLFVARAMTQIYGATFTGDSRRRPTKSDLRALPRKAVGSNFHRGGKAESAKFLHLLK